ncbi:hypothetical protein [Xenorhabdus bovienii]|uniref:hypothetical protein n=1 Tax=Xenorhabdus bovienii TaxID=40576 RepID=UPI0023B2DF1A|nr:hypothetical protein [Xenorhabdus bovienii]MDE9541112.1 hypothetical protein [Xenorhabdus bovienii]
MYYTTEAIAIAERLLLQDITNRLGQITGQGTGNSLKKLDFYYRMYLDETHSPATDSVAIERGLISGLRFII